MFASAELCRERLSDRLFQRLALRGGVLNAHGNMPGGSIILAVRDARQIRSCDGGVGLEDYTQRGLEVSFRRAVLLADELDLSRDDKITCSAGEDKRWF